MLLAIFLRQESKTGEERKRRKGRRGKHVLIFAQSVASVVSGLLDFGLPTLIYNGVFDSETHGLHLSFLSDLSCLVDCNFFGTDVWLESCDFMQKRNFDLVPRVPYFLNNTQVGMFRVLLPVSQVICFFFNSCFLLFAFFF